MPTYEYECSACEAVVEIVQPITASPLKRLRKTDPKPCACNAQVRRRIGTGGGVIFKGAGFYETDYRSESYKKDAKADKDGSEKKADAPATTSSDGATKADKPAPKPAPQSEPKSPGKKKSE